MGEMLHHAFAFPHPVTGAPGRLSLLGGMWHGDACLFDFTLDVCGLAGRITCDWREHGPRFELLQGDAQDPAAQAAMTKIGQLFAGLFHGAFGGMTDEQIAALYPGSYHEGSGYVEDRELDGSLKGPIADLIVRALEPNKLLDAGCAAGELVQQLRTRGVDAWGFDVCPDLTRIAHEEVRAHLRRGTLTEIPFGRDDGFDTLSCIDVFEHIPEDRIPAMVAEFARLGLRNLAVHIDHCGIEHLGHITLRPLSWWDAQLGGAFQRVQAPAADVLQLPGGSTPMRVLRIYRAVEAPIPISRPPSALSSPARPSPVQPGPATTAATHAANS